jgi:glycosyltransferase involved in cell wall biosynthesis
VRSLGDGTGGLRVRFDSRPVAEPRGIGRYARCLLEALREHTAANGGEIVEGHALDRRDDVFHSPWIKGALLRPKLPMVVTVHDLATIKSPGQALREGLRARMRHLALERAARLIVPTRAVAADAEEMLRFDPARIDVIGEAPAPAFSPRPDSEVAAVRRRYRLPDAYLLWVGGLRHPDPHKRVAALVDAPRELPLVLVGDAGQWARELEGVTLTGRVPDDHLAAIYSGAHALVFPSEDEGFGLPAVEALACGTPVVACDIPALREAMGERVTFVEPGDLAGLMVAAQSAVRPAPEPPSWSWNDAAGATWEVYERAFQMA